jgi:hypothetical protein
MPSPPQRRLGYMASIVNPRLAVSPDRLHDWASISVSCDVEFTEFEVNAMNMLGVRYTLQCHLLDMDMLYPDSVAAFDRQEFPRVPGGASTREFTTFETNAAMSELHWYVFGKDTLVAQLTLRNEETGIEAVTRSNVIRVNLAA